MSGSRFTLGAAGALLVALAIAWPAASSSAQPKPAPRSAAPSTPLPPSPPPEPDLAYGAFQRGLYLTAFHEATKRAAENNDPKAMTLLGELYADGLGVPNDDNKAVDWYKLAIERGDREAMFSLAMFRMSGRGGPADRSEAARLLGEAMSSPPTTSRCSISKARCFRRISPRPRF
jgi:TPR repeat protein